MTLSIARGGGPFRSLGRARPARRLILGLTAALLVTGQAAATRTPAAAAPVPRALTWLAAGDSFSAGEGTADSGLVDEMADGGATCARSNQTYAPAAANILVAQRGWNVPAPQLVACTGATTDEFFGTGKGQHAAQVDQAGSGQRYDVITMSFGGNDVGFADVLRDCLLPNWRVGVSWTDMARGASVGRRVAGGYGAVAGAVIGGVQVTDPDPSTRCDPGESQEALEARIDDYVEGTITRGPGDPWNVHYGEDLRRTRLPDFYAQVVGRALAADGAMYVVGYPRLFADPDDWASWRGRTCEQVTRADVSAINAVEEHLNEALQAAVSDANDVLGRDAVHFVDRASIFAGHELCTPGAVEWVNGISPGGRWEHSFHPNEIGYAKTAEQLAGTIDADLGDRFSPAAVAVPTSAAPSPPPQAAQSPPPPEPTTAAPIDDGQSDFDIGSEFESTCVVAWPTAPTYTSTSIQLTMDCTATPGQFLLTQVVYGDPDLPITPGTGEVYVTGTVVDIAESAYGPRFLVVQADSIDLQ